MEQLHLKWNAFQSTVSKSFSLLKQEKEFFDVTLVSDDQLQIPTHKIVLSACSKFFKSVLTKNCHSHPLIYLHGINSTNLNFILDYIYQGEVQIYQEQLDPFLEAGQKLEIDGLFSRVKEEVEVFSHDVEKSFKIDEVENPTQEQNGSYYEIESNSNDKSEVGLTEVGQKIKELIAKTTVGFICTACGKMGKDHSNMRKHAETHIKGLSYNCQECDRTFKSKNTLSSHNTRFHR